MITTNGLHQCDTGIPLLLAAVKLSYLILIIYVFMKFEIQCIMNKHYIMGLLKSLLNIPIKYRSSPVPPPSEKIKQNPNSKHVCVILIYKETA